MPRNPGHQALRRGRVSQPGRVYLVTTTTCERQAIFLDPSHAMRFGRCMSQSHTWGDATALCWVLMPDHWHGLIQLGTHDTLATVVNRFKSVSSKQVRPGDPIWAKGFHDRAIRADDDLRAAARYMIANPLRAGLVQHILDWPFWDCVWL